MERVAFIMKLFPGFQAEYKRRHEQLWPELQLLLKGHGISEYSIFMDSASNQLFAYLTIPDAATLADLREEPIMKKWWTYMKDIMETNEDDSPLSISLTEVFYLP